MLRSHELMRLCKNSLQIQGEDEKLDRKHIRLHAQSSLLHGKNWDARTNVAVQIVTQIVTAQVENENEKNHTSERLCRVKLEFWCGHEDT